MDSYNCKYRPLVSVIIPIYNAEKYLSECILSIINQSYNNLEIILINDGSIDTSLDICNKYKCVDKRIKIISITNHGVSFSRNIGLRYAKGEYVIFVDSDDYLSSDTIDRMLKATFGGRYELVISGYREFNCARNISNEYIISPHILTKNLSLDFYVFFAKAFISIAGIGAKLYSRTIIKKYNIIFREDVTSGEDQIFNYQYYRFIDEYSYIPEPLYNYRKENTESLSNVASYKTALDGYIYRKELKKYLLTNEVQYSNFIFSASCVSYFHQHTLIDESDTYNKFKKRIKKINHLLKGMYYYKNKKWFFLFICLKYDIYFLPYIYYQIKRRIAQTSHT